MAAIPTATPYPTATPRPTYTLFPTPTPRPTYTLFPTATPRPTYTPFPTPTVAQSPTATIPPLSVAESRIYRDFYWGSYSIRLPQGWVVGSEVEPGYTGVSLTQFLAPNADMGFFITVEDLERTAPGVSFTLGEVAHELSNLRRKNGYTSEGVQIVDENTAYEGWLAGVGVAPGCPLKGRTYYHLYSRWLISTEGSVCQSTPEKDFKELTDLMETIQIHPPAR